MKYHLTGYGVSALLHVAVLLVALPVLIWQDDLQKSDEETSVNLSLSQFVPAPPEPVSPVQQEEPPPAAPVPKPMPKAEKKPKPEKKQEVKPKPLKKPKPEKKLVEQPKPVSQSKPVPQRQAQPAPPPVVPARPTVAPAPKMAQPAPPQSNPAAEAAYKKKLQSLIASRKKYPRQAMRDEVDGSVVVAYTVMPNGVITGVRVTKSSGNDWLDKAAVQAVNAASGAMPFPPDIRKAQWPFSLTVNFKLDW